MSSVVRGGFKITLEQLRMASRQSKRRLPTCHNETMRVIMALQAADYDDGKVYPLVKEADECFERAEREKKLHPHKPTTLYHLSKYLVTRKKK